MPKSTRKKRTRNPGKSGPPRIGTTITTPSLVDATSLPPSLPLAVRTGPVPPPSALEGIDLANPPSWYRPPTSKLRDTVERILMMRAAGWEDSVIAEKLGIGVPSIRTYIYMAGKNGWLDFDNAKDHLENLTAHKVLRNLDGVLDGTLELTPTQRDVTLEVAKGTLFKKFDMAPVVAPGNTNVLAIKVEFPAGTINVPVREGTTGGTPAWTEGEVVDAVPK